MATRTRWIFALVVALALVGCSWRSPSAPASSGGTRSSPQVVLPFADLSWPRGVAVDSAGAVYVTDYGARCRLLKLAKDTTSATELPVADNSRCASVAVDGAGNVYVSDDSNNPVLKLAARTMAQTVQPVAHIIPDGVAVDGAGNVYVVDSDKYQVLKLPAGAPAPEVLPFTGLSFTRSVAVDSAGDVDVETSRENPGGIGPTGADQIVKLPAGSSAQQVVPLANHGSPNALAVDGAGNVYVTVGDGRAVLKLAPGSTTPTTLPFTGLENPYGVAVDNAGNVYVADAKTKRVLKLPRG